MRIISVAHNNVEAIFSFNWQNGRADGEFNLIGLFNPISRQLNFNPGSWIHNPNRYRSVGLEGNISEDGSHYRGIIADKKCGEFNLTLYQQ